MNPTSDELRTLLQQVGTIAVIGAKDTPGHPVDGVGRYLMGRGISIIPVHPVRTCVWGLKTYESVRDIPQKVDLVNVFRASQYCSNHAREVLAMKYKPMIFWMQLGIHSVEASQILESQGVCVVQDICLKVEYNNFFPCV